MKLRGLPADMWTGPVDVLHTSETPLSFVPCGFCKFFHVEYFVCETGHTTCRDCGTEDLKKARGGGANAPCWGCGARVSMRRTLLTADELQLEVVNCPCGFKGDLRQIQKHLRKSKYNKGCVLSDKSFELMDSDRFKKSIEDLIAAKQKIEYAEDTLGLFVSRAFVKPFAKGGTTVDEISKIQRNIGVLGRRIDKIEAILRDVHSMDHELLPTLRATFRDDGWMVIDFEMMAASSENYFSAVISGIPLGVMTKQEVIDDEPWLGIHLCGYVLDSTSEKCENRYPLRVKVTIRLHNSLGYILATAYVKTYQDGRFSCPSFENPLTKNRNFVGTQKFIPMEDLHDNLLPFRGKMIFSFEIEPLQSEAKAF